MTEIRFAGFGGQGIILMGIAVARAAALYDVIRDDKGERTRYATQTQSYGPSARGGHSRCDVKISDEEIYYPFIEKPDILVVMSEQAYKKYSTGLDSGGLMILDGDLVREDPPCRHFRIPATRVAEEELGTRVVANMVMLGAVQELTGIVSGEALLKAVLDLLPKSTHELNKRALERGRELARQIAGKCKSGDEI